MYTLFVNFETFLQNKTKPPDGFQKKIKPNVLCNSSFNIMYNDRIRKAYGNTYFFFFVR